MSTRVMEHDYHNHQYHYINLKSPCIQRAREVGTIIEKQKSSEGVCGHPVPDIRSPHHTPASSSLQLHSHVCPCQVVSVVRCLLHHPLRSLPLFDLPVVYEQSCCVIRLLLDILPTQSEKGLHSTCTLYRYTKVAVNR
jgi:hypothetical protein